MSLQVTISPKERVAGRFISRVRRVIQRALAEEAQKNGLSQSEIARRIGVNRSVISREINGLSDLGLTRVAELAWAMGRKPTFDLLEQTPPPGSNQPTISSSVFLPGAVQSPATSNNAGISTTLIEALS